MKDEGKGKASGKRRERVVGREKGGKEKRLGREKGRIRDKEWGRWGGKIGVRKNFFLPECR